MSERVAIFGSRDFTDLDDVRIYIQGLPSDITILTGGAAGVDKTAELEAARLRIARFIFEPRTWPGQTREEYIRELFVRNKLILDSCDRAVAFWTGVQKGGTFWGINYAKKIGIPLLVLKTPS